LVSRLLEDIIRDAKILEQAGVQEVILIAQDITTYGSDLGMQDGIVLLLEKLLAEVPEIPWVRLMYTFPGSISDDLIQLMAEEQRILNYLDIPLQHAHPEVLKRMHRPSNMAAVKDRIVKIRSIIPDLAVRSIFITGFPDESDDEFIELYHFIEDIRFDHVGFFPYHHEPNTPAYSFVDLPQTVKDQRLQQLAALQEGISLEINQKFVGETLDVLFEGSGDGISVGRSYRDAPEIDGLVILNEIVDNGKIIPVRITGALVHDLLGERI
jgi:ribosomal protein S12 methylthiotransferase